MTPVAPVMPTMTFIKNPKAQSPKPKSQNPIKARHQSLWPVSRTWDLGFRIWDLGFTYRYYRPNASSSAVRFRDLQLVRRARRHQRCKILKMGGAQPRY